MYKTVRQGDASLQYTILPQIDEFYVHDMSSVRGSPPVKGHHCEEEEEEDHFWLPSTRVFCYMSIAMVIIITITCCIIATYVIDALIRSPCVVTPSQTKVSVTSEVLMPKSGPLADDQRDDDAALSTTTSSKVYGVFRKLTEDRVLAPSSRSSTLSPTTLEEEPANFELAITETIPPSSEGEHSTPHPSSTERTSTSSSLDVAAESSDSRASIIEAPTNNIVNILRKLKMMKMPRVTLKLRINDTIPQMYMKAGIASYKKGKITTSVLAQGLSLEGLIFKTPEGTIKPWRAIWPFGEDSDMLRRKRYRVFWRDLIGVSIILLMIGSFVMICRLRGILIGRLQDIEEPEVEHQDETQSILLDTQIREIDDKECNNII